MGIRGIFMLKNQKFVRPLAVSAFCNGLVFFSPVSLLVRTHAGVSLRQFFLLQAVCAFVTLLSELPAGCFTDRFGYRTTFITYQTLLCGARWLLFAAFLSRSFGVFLLEAVVEGLAFSFCSGTESAYLYVALPHEDYAVQSARISNWGTAGFFVSTLSYAVLYALFGLEGLLLATGVAHVCGVLSVLALPRDAAASLPFPTAEVSAPASSVRGLLRRKSTVLLIVLLSAAGLAQLLINFFYAEKLAACGLDETWMTPVILGYSAVQLLAEKLLAHIPPKRYRTRFALFFALCGGCLAALGLVSSVVPTLALMLVLPLLLSVSNCLLGFFQNECIDAAGQQQNRASLLNLFNMGVSAAEIFFLIGSSVLSAAGSTLCFVTLGVVMVGGGGILCSMECFPHFWGNFEGN